ncbi:MAG: SMC-Scp complex subunit ScpB [Chloroflexi bacterium]|nr:SMC-Scp complex subunit ScpB [Chloroflexota bacterium]MCY3696274.1 SMC-Scp complex subunit ScpB [Chloroflexota bacterium]MXX32888.1 SMC-Scp complex subunit ScpB [Chloroflexota bacterium]MYD16829.1 SMC-Scp complex subunit ScpB [Chloroflexota bacterium]MYJ01947.1 SMC-Scp complex subunit ScpB [Chloroflexota bacterium]
MTTEETTPVDPLPPPKDLRLAIEALLLVAESPPTIRLLAQVTSVPVSAVEAALSEIDADTSRGIRLRRHSGTVALVSAAEAAPYVERMLGLDTPSRLSRAALETLAVIAYHQPVTREQIERVRGVGASGVIRSLRARDLIAPSGRLDTIGQPLLWSVTPRFLDHFGLSALDQLPPLEDLERPAQQSVLPLEPEES